MAREKIYYSVYTLNEKIWIKADVCEIIDGCLVFSNIDGTNASILIASFPVGYWKYVYEADLESGESNNSQIPFWKRHTKHENPDYSHSQGYNDSYKSDNYRPEREFPPRKFGIR